MPTAVDLFSGAGGATEGLRQAGFRVVAAVDSDPSAFRTYRRNHPAVAVWESDIRSVGIDDVLQRASLESGDLGLLTACPPCQSFSTLGRMDADDARNDLIGEVARFADGLRPAAILFENVPGVARDRRYKALRARLGDMGYGDMRSYDVLASDYGVPQRRRRLIGIALRTGSPGTLPDDPRALLPSGFPLATPNAGEVISAAGPIRRTLDPLHRARTPTPLVLQRIKAIPPGGNRFDLPPELRLRCHQKIKHKGAWAPYGRIRAEGPAPTMTTKCTTPSCGRFVHPTEHRGISLREAALLQTFPADYEFVGNHGEIERQIGNAVPVRLARALGLVVRECVARLRGGPVAA